MAHSNSAKKRVRQNETRRLRNRRRKATVKDAIRQFDTAVAAQDTKQAAEKLKDAQQELDRVAGKGTIHKRTAARRKSRLAKQLNRLSAK